MSSILQAGFGVNIAAQTITTTTELSGVTSSLVVATTPVEHVLVIGYLTVALGAGTTTGTVRIRRGSGITGTVVGNPQARTVTASTTVTLVAMVSEDQILLGEIQYTVSMQQGAATANGTIQEAVIVVLFLS